MNFNRMLAGLLFTGMIMAIACNDAGQDKTKEATEAETPSDNAAGDNAGANPKGIGRHQHVELTHPLDEKMIADGKGIYDVKCSSCHKMTDERLVGPGWKGVTDRRTPEWIMNFVTNTDEMIEKDTASQNMLEVCLVKMPNQNLTDMDARSVLEYMRKNDGKN